MACAVEPPRATGASPILTPAVALEPVGVAVRGHRRGCAEDADEAAEQVDDVADDADGEVVARGVRGKGRPWCPHVGAGIVDVDVVGHRSVARVGPRSADSSEEVDLAAHDGRVRFEARLGEGSGRRPRAGPRVGGRGRGLRAATGAACGCEQRDREHSAPARHDDGVRRGPGSVNVVAPAADGASDLRVRAPRRWRDRREALRDLLPRRVIVVCANLHCAGPPSLPVTCHDDEACYCAPRGTDDEISRRFAAQRNGARGCVIDQTEPRASAGTGRCPNARCAAHLD